MHQRYKPRARDNSRIEHAERLVSRQDLHVSRACEEIAQLLTIAYQRLSCVPRAPSNPASNLAQGALALSGNQSVHECD